jgi:hypothetical protein
METSLHRDLKELSAKPFPQGNCAEPRMVSC